MARRSPGLSERHRKIMEFLTKFQDDERLFPFDSSDWRSDQRKIHLAGRLLPHPTARDGLISNVKTASHAVSVSSKPVHDPLLDSPIKVTEVVHKAGRCPG